MLWITRFSVFTNITHPALITSSFLKAIFIKYSEDTVTRQMSADFQPVGEVNVQAKLPPTLFTSFYCVLFILSIYSIL